MKPAPHNTQWQTLDISVKDGRIVVKLGDQTTADYTDPTTDLKFRNLRITELPVR